MSSQFSTNLRTELPGTGEQAGTWGNTTNTSLGSVLEQAIAGVSGGPYIGGSYPAVNFPTDADITLTANNGSVDQSRSAVLVVASSVNLTATRNVIAPASASKVYTVRNSTTGGQSIQIKYATGTGVIIPTGVTRSVFGDGSNFFWCENLIDSAVNATTSTTQSLGDNTTKIATTAFVQSTIQTLYPIGSIYTATVATNPNTLFGFGTWVAFGAGRVMIGNGGGFTAGATGGSADSTLPSHTHSATSTVSDPGHNHNAQAQGVAPSISGGAGNFYATASNTDSAVTGISVSTSISTEGSSPTNTNLPPYVVVYMWNRTA